MMKSSIVDEIFARSQSLLDSLKIIIRDCSVNDESNDDLHQFVRFSSQDYERARRKQTLDLASFLFSLFLSLKLWTQMITAADQNDLNEKKKKKNENESSDLSDVLNDCDYFFCRTDTTGDKTAPPEEEEEEEEKEVSNPSATQYASSSGFTAPALHTEDDVHNTNQSDLLPKKWEIVALLPNVCDVTRTNTCTILTDKKQRPLSLLEAWTKARPLKGKRKIEATGWDKPGEEKVGVNFLKDLAECKFTIESFGYVRVSDCCDGDDDDFVEVATNSDITFSSEDDDDDDASKKGGRKRPRVVKIDDEDEQCEYSDDSY